MALEPAQFAVEASASATSGRGGTGGAGEMALPRVGKRGAPQAFARKLFEILTTESQEVIAWNKQGNAFHVKDVETFSEDTLTKYYRHSKFSSFQRQLNLYSFRKIVKGPDAGGYAHPMFRRDRPDDLYHVRRSISGSARYEPAARTAAPSSTKKTPSASRRGGARASSKARASGWAPARAHKSNAAVRRIGKLRSAPNPRRGSDPPRGSDHQSNSPGHATGVSAATGDVSSAGERSPWTSGESSDSDLVGGASEGVSDSDSDVEGEDREEEQEQEWEAVRHTCKGASDDSTKRLRDNHAGRWFSRSGASGKESATAAEKAGKDGEVSGARRAGSGLGVEGLNSSMASSPTRRSPFNFFKKTFSFMEKSGSHNRGLSSASVDTGGGGAGGHDAAAVSISSLMVDTSAMARAAAAGLTDPSSREAVPPVVVGGVTTAAGVNKPSPLLALSSPMTPKSSAEAAAALAAATAAADAAAMPPPNPKRDQREELGLVEQLTNMVEVFDICDLLRKVSTSNSSRLDKNGAPTKNSPLHLRNMSVDTDQGLPQSPQSRDGQSGLGSLASMELVRDSSKDWDTLMAGSADVSDLGNTMVQSVAEFFSF